MKIVTFVSYRSQ